MNACEVILHLSLIEGVGPSSIQTIIAHKPQEVAWDMLYDFTSYNWQQLGISHKTAPLLVDGLKDKRVLEKELDCMAKNSIQWASILDENYPQNLLQIHAPPSVLFWQGNLITRKSLAIVGSRDANAYAERFIHAIVPQLVAHDFCIVSGGALGADTMAHRAALQAGGKTIVVLGSGLLRPHPRTNTRLFEAILDQNGALVSPYPSNMEPYPGNFPARNRIISGLSQGIVVVQAAKKSGTRITAQFALEQGRDVFAVPGPVDDPLSAGCHALIQEGAKLITGPADILEEYGITQSNHPGGQSSIPFDNLNKKSHAERDEKVSKKGGNPLHQKILAACLYPQSIDELAQLCGIELGQMQRELFALQMDGVMEQDFMGLWKVI